MNSKKLSQIIGRAHDMCAHSGGRLTEKRERILEVLIRSNVPLSAYEVADAYKTATDASMPVMSVYRILDFLESEQLVHKLSSTNKYVACSHIACNHAHEVPQFLICGNCERVKEIGVSKSLIDDLSKQVSRAGYALTNHQLELQCLCSNCATADSE